MISWIKKQYDRSNIFLIFLAPVMVIIVALIAAQFYFQKINDFYYPISTGLIIYLIYGKKIYKSYFFGFLIFVLGSCLVFAISYLSFVPLSYLICYLKNFISQDTDLVSEFCTEWGIIMAYSIISTFLYYFYCIKILDRLYFDLKRLLILTVTIVLNSIFILKFSDTFPEFNIPTKNVIYLFWQLTMSLALSITFYRRALN